MRLVSVDPGASTGYAVFDDAVLVQCGVVRAEKLGEVLFTGAESLVIEIPRVYPGARQEVPPNDLIRLALRAGEVKGLYRSIEVEAHELFPRDWKGGIDKDTSHRRVLAVLTAEERLLVEAAKLPKTTKHNMLDAIGIGLHHLKRRYRGSYGRENHDRREECVSEGPGHGQRRPGGD